MSKGVFMSDILMNQNRLRWASRRGMLELDLVLEPFVNNVYPKLSENDKVLFELLLKCEDQDLFQWFMKKTTPEDDSLKQIVNVILSHTGLQS